MSDEKKTREDEPAPPPGRAASNAAVSRRGSAPSALLRVVEALLTITAIVHELHDEGDADEVFEDLYTTLRGVRDEVRARGGL